MKSCCLFHFRVWYFGMSVIVLVCRCTWSKFCRTSSWQAGLWTHKLPCKTRSTIKPNAEEILVCFVVSEQLPFCGQLAHAVENLSNLSMHFFSRSDNRHRIGYGTNDASTDSGKGERGRLMFLFCAFSWCGWVHVLFLFWDNQ